MDQSDIAEMIGISVDTLNNYKKLTELIPELDELVSTGILGDNATIIDVMQWMISHQDARRNLSPGELIYANSMVAEEIALENKEKQLSTLKQNQENIRSVQMDKTDNNEKSHTSPTHTREQVAKMSGVGTGTVARYTSGNLYMNLY